MDNKENNEIRPDLKPADPRGSNKAPNDFDMVGAIDGENTFNVASGESRPHRW